MNKDEKLPTDAMIEAQLRAAFEEGFRVSPETSMPAYLAWELSATFTGLSAKQHKSDCAVHNAPAEEPGPCDCNGMDEQTELATMRSECAQLRIERNYWREQFIGKTVDASINMNAARTPDTETLSTRAMREGLEACRAYFKVLEETGDRYPGMLKIIDAALAPKGKSE